jgi:hypothetical protein
LETRINDRLDTNQQDNLRLLEDMELRVRTDTRHHFDKRKREEAPSADAIVPVPVPAAAANIDDADGGASPKKRSRNGYINQYNLFVREAVHILPTVHPDLKPKNRFTFAAAYWAYKSTHVEANKPFMEFKKFVRTGIKINALFNRLPTDFKSLAFVTGVELEERIELAKVVFNQDEITNSIVTAGATIDDLLDI